jgi:hypothetical protein
MLAISKIIKINRKPVRILQYRRLVKLEYRNQGRVLVEIVGDARWGRWKKIGDSAGGKSLRRRLIG